jgi:glucose/arabinose dehydrogenase
MNTNEDRHEPLDLSQYEANRSKFPPDELAKYWGKQVAFSPDGRRIVASGDTLEQLDAALEAAGIHFSQVVTSYIDHPDESWI